MRVTMLAVLCWTLVASAQVPYGANPAAGKTFTHDGVRLYFEVYGRGPPLLMVHGNGASIGTLAAQIEHFSKRYQVIAMDSRDHGKSGDSPVALTYEAMTEDLSALLIELKVGPALVLGWSDGAIEGLLLAMKHPQQVTRLAAMAANLTPIEQSLNPEFTEYVKAGIASISEAERRTPKGQRALRVLQLNLDQPHLSFEALGAVTAPTLVLAADHDAIRDEHTLGIYHALPNAQLVIFPNATHMVPYDDPVAFNAAVERFFRAPFVKKDRLKDFATSYERQLKSLPR